MLIDWLMAQQEGEKAFFNDYKKEEKRKRKIIKCALKI